MLCKQSVTRGVGCISIKRKNRMYFHVHIGVWRQTPMEWDHKIGRLNEIECGKGKEHREENQKLRII